MSQNQNPAQNQNQHTLNRTQSRSASFRKPAPTAENLSGTAHSVPRTTTLSGHNTQGQSRDSTRAPSLETFSTFDSSAAALQNRRNLYEIPSHAATREELVASHVPQQIEVEDEFKPHTALRPPPRSVRRALSVSPQPEPQRLSPSSSYETLGSTVVVTAESLSAPHVRSRVQPLNHESLSSSVQTSDFADVLAQVTSSSYEDFSKTVEPIEMGIMGPASHYVHERRKSSHGSETQSPPPPPPKDNAPSLSQSPHIHSIMSYTEIQAALDKLERGDKKQGEKAGPPPRLRTRSTGRDVLSPATNRASLALDAPPSMPNMRGRSRGIVPSGMHSREMRLPFLSRDPSAEPIQWTNPFATSVDLTLQNRENHSRNLVDGPEENPWDPLEFKPSLGQPKPHVQAPLVDPPVHYSLPGNPSLTRVLSKNKTEWPDYTRGWKIEGPPGSSPPTSEHASRVPSFTNLRNTHPQPRGRSPLRRSASAGGCRSMLGWFRCCAEPDISNYVVDTPPRRNSLTASARVSVQLDQAWCDIELPERNKTRGPMRLPGA